MIRRVLGYWDVRGRAEPIRYLLHFRKVDFVDKRYARGDGEWQKDKFNLGLDFPNLPYYMDGDVKLSQTFAILRYLAGKYGLDGKTDQQRLRVFLAEQQSADFRNNLRTVAVSNDYEKLKDDFIKTLPDAFSLWNKFLGNRKYLAGDDVTYVDFMVFENLDFYRLFHPSIIDEFPTLKDYHSRIKNLPELQGYFNSSTYRRWPIFAPHFKFGGSGEPPKHL
ncbi:glutathione S-transferase Mu 1 [Caerostris extrusa]|uniref:glutathione transferase n=1 Tax=Caerostris extrusa TaxID=172846 RepID=A0AAV4NXC9_CAEEX|nr:glutathione S-transferase Mu 1 [Caerostris extrusa]